jgi:hypothetical protein
MNDVDGDSSNGVVAGSFRDPSGFLFVENGYLFRNITASYRDHYKHLMESGLYDKCIADQMLVPHETIDLETLHTCHVTDDTFAVIKPEIIPFISYPYEWCFSQLKDAALHTLNLQKTALEYDMTLKDASAYNIQFMNGKPVLIDTLSFERYEEGTPWVAYRQFCQHFLAPLALACHRDIRLIHLLQTYIDGIPLDLASELLPASTRLSFSLLAHLHLHAGSQKRYSNKTVSAKKSHVRKTSLLGLINHLESAVRKLNWRPAGTEWGDYYKATNYSDTAFIDKKSLVNKYLDQITPTPKMVWDLGGNTGVFSRIASGRGWTTVSSDIDPAAVEVNYTEMVSRKESHLLPLLLDLTSPSPGNGWANTERSSFFERGPADVVMALALIHHLAISNNLPLGKIADTLRGVCSWLIIEFVPKSDSQVERLLTTRPDIFPNYTREDFENEFGQHFETVKSENVDKTERTLYLMRSR